MAVYVTVTPVIMAPPSAPSSVGYVHCTVKDVAVTSSMLRELIGSGVTEKNHKS